MPGKADRQRILIEKQKEEGFQYLFKKIDPKYNRKKIFFNFNMWEYCAAALAETKVKIRKVLLSDYFIILLQIPRDNTTQITVLTLDWCCVSSIGL